MKREALPKYAVRGVAYSQWAYWCSLACDEYLRTRLQRAVTITALVVALGSLGYFCLELSGFPRQSIVWVSIVGWSVFNLQLSFVVLGASRGEDSDHINYPAASS